MRRIYSIALVFILITASSFTVTKRQEYRIKTVVIDAGHGGHDSGCLGASAKEKNITLAVALKLGRMIEESFPDVKVVFTRKTDVFIPLHERADIANRNKADLFICIHCNSGASKGAFGVETYVMGLHKTDENLAVARRENAAVLLEEDYKIQYEGFDPNSPEANIIFNLYQNQFLNQSLQFASNVQNQVVEYAGRHNRGVRQAGFLVLYKTAMPAVLIETGFLTHREEEKFLLSEKGQNNISASIFRAFREYKIDAEPSSASNAKVESKEISKPVETPVKESSGPDKVPAPSSIPKKAFSNEDTLANKLFTEKSIPKPAPEHPESPVYNSSVDSSTTKNPAASKSAEVFITVQIGATNEAEKKPMKFNHVEGLMTKKSTDGFIRYVVGQFNSVADAQKRQIELKSLGFKDCFLSAYKADQKITVAEALKTINKK